MKAHFIFPFAVLSMFLSSTPASAAGDGSLLPSIGRMVLAFVLVVVLIYVSILVIRRLFLGGRGKTSGLIKPVDSFPLGQRARLFVVEMHGRVFLLGVTDQRVSTIAEFDSRELGEMPAPPGITSFVRQLNSFTRPGRNAKESSTG
jgi:flagellar biosynthetic protein FliO